MKIDKTKSHNSVVRTLNHGSYILFGTEYGSAVLLGEARLNKLHKLIDSLLLIGAACDDAYLGIAHDTEGKHAEKALGVDSALVLLHPNGGLELVSLLEEKNCRTRK